MGSGSLMAAQIGHHLALLRRAKGMSQQQTGIALGEARGTAAWSRQAVNSAERGRRSWTADDVVALAQVFSVRPGSLFDEVPECSVCNGEPPAGFACLTCGSGPATA